MTQTDKANAGETERSRLLVIGHSQTQPSIVPLLQGAFPNLNVTYSHTETADSKAHLSEIAVLLSPGIYSKQQIFQQLLESTKLVAVVEQTIQPAAIRDLLLPAIEDSSQQSLESATESSLTTLNPNWLRLLQLKYEDALSDRAIAQEMGVSDRTIRNYWLRIQDELGIETNPRKDPRIEILLAIQSLNIINSSLNQRFS